MNFSLRYCLLILFVSFSTISVTSQHQDSPASEVKQEKKKEVGKAETSITQHSVVIDGQTINYTATAGTLLLHNEKEEPIALYGFIAYTKNDIKDLSKRSIMFAYNGGPGSSSIWLHMGVLGPKRTVVNDPGITPAAPYKLEDNPYSVLDISDLVMIDPVGTGISRTTGDAEGKDFWGVDQDMRTVSLFIKQYINENNRWNSPKYLLGESYGTLRNAAVVNYLQNRLGISMNGVIMVSAVLDLRTITYVDGDDISFVLYLPTLAATAWYHNEIHDKPKDLHTLLDEVRKFASGDYTLALMKGDRLTGDEKNAIAEKLAAYTGLDKEYILRANLRVRSSEFGQELLREGHETIGRLDSRYTGINQDLLDQTWDYDPQSSSISPAYTTTFMDYYYNTLKVDKKHTYHVSARAVEGFNWDWKHAQNGIGGWPRGVNTGVDLAEAMTKNPNLKVMFFNGLYDLATPFYGIEYSMDHLELEPKIRQNIIMKYFEAGHMMYTHRPSLEKFKKDVKEFVQRVGKV